MSGGARTVRIKAAMRSADPGRLAEEIARLEAGGIDGLHFDVMDGRFVPEIYLGPLMIKGLRKYTQLPFEVHLLVEQPDGCVDQYVDAGANCVLVHLEAARDPAAVLAHIRSRGCQAGLATRPDTAASLVAPHLSSCDVINVMSVTPGQPGVLNDAGVRQLSDVASLAAQRGSSAVVQVDGAVSMATRARFLEAGAAAMVAGYPVFSSQDVGLAVAQLRHGQQPSAAPLARA